MSDEPISGNNDMAVKSKRLDGGRTHSLADSTGAGYEASVIGSDCSGGGPVGISVQHNRAADRDQRGARGAKALRPENRDAIRRCWEKAKEKTNLMVEASNAGDPIELASAAFGLDHLLGELWGMRRAREPDWAGAINFLQGVLKKADLETMTPSQCQAIQTIVTDHVGPATVDRDDIETCIRILRGAGLDPWRPISADPKDQ
jgi:hypothetical protein